jgi:tetratricopeptide (TPR) repeat protein
MPSAFECAKTCRWIILSVAIVNVIGLWRITCAASPIELDDVAAAISFQQRSENEQDRLEAVSLFGAARLLEQRQDLPAALRRYQRAHRHDPGAAEILRHIVPLAFNLGREQEAVRYATRLAQLDTSDPVLLRRLGVVLTEQGEVKKALALYERIRSREAGSSKSSSHVMLLMEMGRLYFLAEQNEKSADMFERVSEALEKPDEHGLNAVLLKAISGDKGEIHELMAAAFLEAGRPELAAKAFQRLAKFESNKAVSAYHEAQVHAKAGRYDEALAQLQTYFDARETVKGVAPYELLSDILAEQKKSADLLPRLEKLIAEQPASIPLHFTIAEKHFEQNQFDKAEPFYKTVLEKQPVSQVYGRLAAIYRHTGQPEKLLELLSGVVDKSETLEILGKELAALVENKDLTREILRLAREKYQEVKPENSAAQRAAGLIALEAKEFDAANTLLDLAVKSQPADKAQIYLSWGLKLFLDEQFPQSAVVFQRGIDEKALPDSKPVLHFYLAGALEMSGKHDGALAAARSAAEKQPDNARFASRAPSINYRAKRYDEAAAEYKKLLAKYDENFDSEDTREVLHDARLVLSNIAVIKNDLPQAEEWIEQVLDEFPDDVGALNDLGYLWADQNKRLHAAHRMIRKAVEEEPENAAYRDSLGWVLFRLGKHEEARVEQEKAVELSKKKDSESDGVMYDHLGDIYAALHLNDKAREAWQHAAAAFEKAGEKDKLEAIRKKLR